MNNLKIILFCGSRFALQTMQELVFFKQLSVVVIPEDCSEMFEQSTALLKNTGIPVVKVQNQNCEHQLCQIIDQYQIDLGLVMTFSYKLTSTVYERPSKGIFNLHPGPLPFYRGADPIFRQITNREKRAGVTLHQIDHAYDRGPIVAMEMIPLQNKDTYGILTTKLSVVAAKLVGILLKLFQFDATIPLKPQDESKAVYYKKQKAKDVSINWETMDADAIVALINACNPWNKGAVAKINNTIVRLLSANPKQDGLTVNIPGTILSFQNGEMSVSTLAGQILDVQWIYLEEGFLKPDQLHYKGIFPGMRFEEITEL